MTQLKETGRRPQVRRMPEEPAAVPLLTHLTRSHMDWINWVDNGFVGACHYLVQADPASPSWAPSWTLEAVRWQSHLQRRSSWTGFPAGTPPAPPSRVSSSVLREKRGKMSGTFVSSAAVPTAEAARLTLVQFEDGVGHGWQQSFTF